MMVIAPMCCRGERRHDDEECGSVIALATSMALFAVAVSSKTSRGDQRLLSAMVVVIEFGVAGSGGMCLHKMSLFRLCFPSVNVPNVCMMIEVSMYTSYLYPE